MASASGYAKWARRPMRRIRARLVTVAATAVVLTVLIPFSLSTTPVDAAAFSSTATTPSAPANVSSAEASASEVDPITDQSTPAEANVTNEVTGSPVLTGSQALSGPPVIPGSGHAYLGAFVDPAGTQLSVGDPTGEQGDRYGPADAVDELSLLSQFNQGLARPLSLVSVYQSWTSTVLTTQLDRILAAGAIPLITWSCGSPDATVALADQPAAASSGPASSARDTIIQLARQLKAFGGPVLLRWFPDANNPQTAQAQGGRVDVCLGSRDPTTAGPDYVSAFQAIHNLFAGVGATNVGFVWSIDPTPQCTEKGCVPDWTAYDPGESYVDWYGADAYNHSPTAPTLTTEFGAWYSSYQVTGKPMLISTAAVAGAQSAYLQQMTQLSSLLPHVKGLVYFDAPDQTAMPPTRYQLSDAGLKQFEGLSGEDQFHAGSGVAPTVTISAPPNQPRNGNDVVQVQAGQVVRITANVAVPDRGGSVDFLLANGVSIPGCAAVPVNLAGTCETSSLVVGPHQITALYSGDAEYAEAQSSPLALQVTPTSTPGNGFCDLSPPLAAGTSGAAGTLCGPPTIPGSGKAYLGAYVKPSYSVNTYPAEATPTEDELVDLPGLNAALTSGGGQPLSMVHVYQEWNTPVPNYQLQEILATGAIPLIDWKCGDADANVAAGVDDGIITSLADQLASLKAPLFLRWFYEPNFPNSSEDASCVGTAGPGGYVEAWRHIHDLFVAAGATNVAFVWSIGTGGPDQDLINYFPGSNYVDWIAADGYDRPRPHQPVTFTQRFQSWYDEFSGFGLPMMVGESGAFAAAQGSWLQDAATRLSDPSSTGFSQIRAIGYFDTSSAYDYSLTDSCTQNAGRMIGCGMKEFRRLAASTLFEPFRRATTVSSVSVPSYEASPMAGQEIQLSAGVSPTDFGGSLSFYADGTSVPLRGCADISISQGSSCETDALPAGHTGVVAVYNGDASFAPSTSQSLSLAVRTAPAPIRIRAPAIPPPDHAYLGAWLNPTPSAFPPGAEMKALPGFDATLGRPLSIVHLYQGWNPVTSDYLIRDALASGGIPMIDWSCAPPTPGYSDSDAAVIAGYYDNLIRGFAGQLAALKAPVFLRWFYEPNLPASTAYTDCVGSGGQPGDYGPAGYQRAFQHIHDIFQAAGAYNVAFVFSLSVNGEPQQFSSFYPGSAYVDWIAADGYVETTTPDPNIVQQTFGVWYNQFSTYGKPMMISETAAIRGGQAAYLGDLAAALSPLTGAAVSMAGPTANQTAQFPLIRAVSYFDAPGRFLQHPYAFDSHGFQAFQSMSKLPYFLPPQQRSTTGITVSQTPARWDTAVRLTASINADNGGAVSFSDNGTPIAGCQDVALVAGASCTTTTMVEGSTGSIQAAYTGDAAYLPSKSGPQAVTVMTWSGQDPNGISQGIAGPSVGTNSAPFPAFSGVPTIGGVAAITFRPVDSRSPSPTAASTGRPFYTSDDHAVAIGPAATSASGSSWQGVAVLAGFALIACLIGYMASSWSRDRWRRKPRRRDPVTPRPDQDAHITMPRVVHSGAQILSRLIHSERGRTSL